MPIKVRKQFLKNKAKERLTPAEADFIAKVNSLATSWSQRLVKWKRGVKAGEPILVASDCSGYGSDLIALTLLGLRNSVKSVLVCDKDQIKQMLHEAVVESCGIAVSKDSSLQRYVLSGQLPDGKPYTAGYPCPSYSNFGKKRVLILYKLRTWNHHGYTALQCTETVEDECKILTPGPKRVISKPTSECYTRYEQMGLCKNINFRCLSNVLSFWCCF